jgi:hypothetical protein
VAELLDQAQVLAISAPGARGSAAKAITSRAPSSRASRTASASAAFAQALPS